MTDSDKIMSMFILSNDLSFTDIHRLLEHYNEDKGLEAFITLTSDIVDRFEVYDALNYDADLSCYESFVSFVEIYHDDIVNFITDGIDFEPKITIKGVSD